MYGPESIRGRLREQPFRLLRIHASEGLKFDIHHPDLVMVGASEIAIGIPKQAGELFFSRLIRVAYIHIVAIEELVPQPA